MQPTKSLFMAILAEMLLCHASIAGAGMISVVSNTADWRESTDFIFVNTNDHPWAGVASLPSPGTFTLTPSSGGFADHIDNVPGTVNILARGGVRYFRTEFTLPPFDTLTADLRISMDNDVHIFLNGAPIALESSGFGAGENFHGGVHHRLFIGADGAVVNGFLGGDPFDTFAATIAPSIWNVGVNEFILGIRNASPPEHFGDLGGFSFRADIESNINSVPEPSGFVLLAGMVAVGLMVRLTKALRIGAARSGTPEML